MKVSTIYLRCGEVASGRLRSLHLDQLVALQASHCRGVPRESLVEFSDEKTTFRKRRFLTSYRQCTPPRAHPIWTQCELISRNCWCPVWWGRRSGPPSESGRWCKRSKREQKFILSKRRHSESSFSYRTSEPIHAKLIHEVGETLAGLHLQKGEKTCAELVELELNQGMLNTTQGVDHRNTYGTHIFG